MSSITAIPDAKLELPYEAIAEFCERWGVERLELFGSVLRDDFTDDSDVDFLYVASPTCRWGLSFVDACDELAAIVGRPVDMVSRKAVERSANPFRRRSILSEARVIYAA